MTTGRQAAALSSGDLDLGFLRPPLEYTDLVTEAVQEEQLVAVLPKGQPLSAPAERPIDVKDLAAEPFVLFPPTGGQGLSGQIIECCRVAGFQPRVTQEAIQMETLLSLVAGNAGVTLAPAAGRALARPGVVCRSLTSSPTVTLAAAWRPDDDRAALHWVLEVVRQAAGTLLTNVP